MNKIKSFIDSNALVLAMLIGVAGHSLFYHLSWLLPPMIFLMLFFTFCKVNPLDLRLHTWHWLVLVVQLVLTGIVYYGLLLSLRGMSLYLNITEADIAVVSQGLMMCVIMPTATAAPIIAGKLGGSIQNLTTFTLLSNLATAVIAPAFFPIVNPCSDIDFWVACWMILRKVSPLLLGPFFAAWILRVCYNAHQKHKGSSKMFILSAPWSSMPFYIWIGTLVILMAQITQTMLTQHYNLWTIIVLCVGALLTCLIQFRLGRVIGFRFPAPNKGEDYHDVLIDPAAANYTMPEVSRITAGQAFGQKNTTLGVWMSQAYLTPLSAVGPAAYIVWQNLINSMQLLVVAKRVKKRQ